MERIRPLMPRARTQDLVVEELPDETLVYDLKRHKAHCLNRSATVVWRHCDGRTTLSEMATILEEELELPQDEGIVRLALERLRKAKLLEGGINIPQEPAGPSRRELVRKLAVLGGLAIALPIVTSITSPVAALQASCVRPRDCRNNCAPLGLPCCNRPGTVCVERRPGRCRCR